jgi:hypothetical protein
MPDKYGKVTKKASQAGKNKQYGVSGYAKDKRKTLRELDMADPNYKEKMDNMNPIDKVQEQMDRDNDDEKGITERIRNIFFK